MDTQSELRAINDKLERILIHLESTDSKDFKDAKVRFMHSVFEDTKSIMGWVRLTALCVSMTYFLSIFYYIFYV